MNFAVNLENIIHGFYRFNRALIRIVFKLDIT